MPQTIQLSRAGRKVGIYKPEARWDFVSRPLLRSWLACADNSSACVAGPLARRRKNEVVLRILWWSIRRPLILDFSRPSRRPRLCAEPRSRSRHVAIHPVTFSAPHLFLHHISSYCLELRRSKTDKISSQRLFVATRHSFLPTCL